MRVDARRAGGQNRVPTARTLVPLFGYLRSCGIVPPPPGVVPAPLEDLLSRYRRYLRESRGLAPSTVVSYEGTARLFLSERTVTGGGETGVEGLCGAGVTGFLLRECSRLAVGSAKNRVNHLRSLLRFLQLAGVIASKRLLPAGTALVAPLTPPLPVAAAFAGALEARSPRPFFSRLISTRPPRVRVFLPSVA